MEITLTHFNEPLRVTVLQPHGPLDATTYGELIEAAQKEYEAGVHHMLIDLSDTPHMSSAGIVGIHTIVKLMQGTAPSQSASGWEATQSAMRNQKMRLQERVKLLSPSPNVERVLKMVGFQNFLEIHTDLDEAVSSFLD